MLAARDSALCTFDAFRAGLEGRPAPCFIISPRFIIKWMISDGRAKRALAFIACLTPFAASGQVVCALGPGADAYMASKDQRPSADAMQLIGGTYNAVKNICGANCPEVVLFRNATAANLMLIASGGRAKLVYNPNFISGVYDRWGDAGVAGVVSHELGQALDDTLGAAWVEKSWSAELRADAWAGCVLAKSNFDQAGMKSALASLEEHPSPAHPGWNVRLPAIRVGYTHCGGTLALDGRGGRTR